MITLHWRQVSDLRIESQHGDWLLSIDRRPNWMRVRGAMVYDYAASAHQYGTALHDLGEFNDSVTARGKCAEFINSQQEVCTL